MRPLRLLLVLLLIGGGVGASLVFVSKTVKSLHGSPLFHSSPSPTSTAAPRRLPTTPSGGTERRRPRRAPGRRPAPPATAAKRPAANSAAARRTHAAAARTSRSGGGLFDVSGLGAVLIAALEIAAGLLLLGLLAVRVRAATRATPQPPRVRAV